MRDCKCAVSVLVVIGTTMVLMTSIIGSFLYLGVKF